MEVTPHERQWVSNHRQRDGNSTACSAPKQRNQTSHYWSFVRGIHQSPYRRPVDSTPKGPSNAESDGVSNHQPHDCLLNRLFKAQIKETVASHECHEHDVSIRLFVQQRDRANKKKNESSTLLFISEGNPSVTSGLSSRMANNTESVLMRWGHALNHRYLSRLIMLSQ